MKGLFEGNHLEQVSSRVNVDGQPWGAHQEDVELDDAVVFNLPGGADADEALAQQSLLSGEPLLSRNERIAFKKPLTRWVLGFFRVIP